MTNAIELASVTRTFGRATALNDVTLAVPQGSICGLLGRNGAGKTTIMSIVSGQDRPSSGEVRVLGQRPFENEAIASQISFVRDNQRYPDKYQLRHVLRIAPDFAPNWSAEVAGELAEAFRIPTATHIAKFSRGQLSSVAIILGLASRAPVTLLDEPYLGLDVTARSLLHDMLLRDYSAHPRTIIFSTHLIEESEALFDRVVIVDRGRIRVDAEAEKLRAMAFTLSGTAEAVDRLSSGRTVLVTRSVSGLKSVTVAGELDAEIAAQASRAGAIAASASLQDLVEAFGADQIPSTTTEDRELSHLAKGAHS